MAKPKEKELSALELMIEHADSMSSSVVGAPKQKKRRTSSNEPDFSFVSGETEDDDIEYYVGPGSRAKNREAKAKRAMREKDTSRQVDITVSQAPQAVPVNQPNPREVESALEELFIAGERSGDDIVKAIKDGTAVSAKTQQALEDWMQWEKSEAFKEKNKAKSDPHGAQPGSAVGGAANDSSNDDGGGGLDDLLGGDGNNERGRRRGKGKRYGRNRGERRGPGRRLPPRGRRFPHLKGKLGAVLGIGAALGVGYLIKKNAQEEFADGTSNAGVTSDEYQSNGKPTPISSPDVGQTKQADGAAVQAVDKKAERIPSIVQDSAVDGATVLLAGASKKIPVIGSVLGNGLQLANNVSHINDDETLSDAEKTQAKKEATGSAVGGATGGSLGAIAGGWVGGILGSVVPVAGTAAGAALGATIGGILGDYFGSSVGEYVADKITDESDNMLAEGEKDRKEKMEEYNDTTLENQDKSKTQAPIVLPFNLGGLAGGLPGSGAGTYQGPMRAQPARRMDSKQVQDIAAKAISEGGLGSVSEQFESGGRGVGTVSTGQGDAGGVSYGKHQLATNNGSMMNFLNSPEGKPFLQRFGGLAPGTAQFNSVYKDVANTQGADLDKAQSDYITRTHYAPMVAKLQNDVGVDLSQRGAGVKEMIYSTAVQYGSGSSVVANALKGKDVNAMSDPELIKAVQDYKAGTTDRYFKSSSAQTQQSVAMRAANEKDVLLKVDAADREKKAVNTPKPVESESAQDKRIAEKFPDLPKGDPNTDYSNTSVDKTPVPDLTAKGPQAPRLSPEEHERQLKERVALAAPEVNRIEPVAQPEPAVERQPLVTEGDIARQEAPEPAQVIAPTEQPKAQARSSSAAPQTQTSAPGAAHTLDAIPVFLDDPMTNMITLGYM